MCGIYGGYWHGSSEPPTERLAEAQRLLHHRGPDDRGLDILAVAYGTQALGHTRLSIIDLSPGGHQPMRSPDGNYTIVFNGEIYNYRELRQELRDLGHTFRTDSDTEVLLAAWSQWGADCLRRLIGMFAFAVSDRREQSLTLVRDAFGIKPMFYAPTVDGLIFASEMPALLALRPEAPELNYQRAYDYLIHGVQDRGSNTFVQGVHHVPPAHWMRIDLRATPLHPVSARWWNPSIAETSSLSFAEAAEALRSLFLDSVKVHLRADVPLGVALSGGIDSSAIAGAMRHLEPEMDIHSFSYIADGEAINEDPWIDLVNATISAVPHKVRIGSEELWADLCYLMKAQGEPFGGTSMYAEYCVFRRAREEGITVVLEGQGGDELLGGYSGYPGQLMLSYFERFSWLAMTRFARDWARWPERSAFGAWRALVGQLLPDELYNMGNSALGRTPVPRWMNAHTIARKGIKTRPVRPSKSDDGKGRRLMETLLQSMTVNGLPHLLRYGDRNAMAHSIENRVPFLTLPLAEFVLSLPERYLVSPVGETKAVFRAAMRGIVPDAILHRRDKVGFDTPMREWMRGQILKELGHLLDERLTGSRLFHPMQLKAHLSDTFESLEGFSWQIWRIYNVMSWHRQIIADRAKVGNPCTGFNFSA